ncbi:mediator of RNA polymerase II mRNAion subunit 9, partial [Huso huso]
MLELNKLKTKIQEARKQISTMPGISMSPEQQQQLQLQNVRSTSTLKTSCFRNTRASACPIYLKH